MKKTKVIFTTIALLSVILQCLHYLVWDKTLKNTEEQEYRNAMEELDGVTVDEFWNKIFPLEEKISKEKYDILWEKYYYFKALTKELTSINSSNKISSFVKFETPRFFYDTGYNKITGGFNNKYDIAHAFLAICFLIIPLSIVYHSKERGYKCSRVKLVFLALLVEIIVYIPELICVMYKYGTQGISEQAYSLIHLSNWSTGNTLLYYLIILYVTRVIGLIFIGASFYLVSQFLHKIPLVAGAIIIVFEVVLIAFNESSSFVKYLGTPVLTVLGNAGWSNYGRIGGQVLLIASIAWIAFCFNFRVMHFTKDDYDEWKSHFDFSKIRYKGTLK